MMFLIIVKSIVHAVFNAVLRDKWSTKNKLPPRYLNKRSLEAELYFNLPAKVTSKKTASCYDVGIIARLDED